MLCKQRECIKQTVPNCFSAKTSKVQCVPRKPPGVDSIDTHRPTPIIQPNSLINTERRPPKGTVCLKPKELCRISFVARHFLRMHPIEHHNIEPNRNTTSLPPPCEAILSEHLLGVGGMGLAPCAKWLEKTDDRCNGEEGCQQLLTKADLEAA